MSSSIHLLDKGRGEKGDRESWTIHIPIRIGRMNKKRKGKERRREGDETRIFLKKRKGERDPDYALPVHHSAARKGEGSS